MQECLASRIADLVKRHADILLNPHDLPLTGKKMSVRSHQDEYGRRQDSLNRAAEFARARGCDDSSEVSRLLTMADRIADLEPPEPISEGQGSAEVTSTSSNFGFRSEFRVDFPASQYAGYATVVVVVAVILILIPGVPPL